MNDDRSSRWAWWPIAITALNVLVASGFSVAGLVAPSSILPPDAGLTVASALFAMYAAARTIPLAITVLVAIVLGETRVVVALALLAGAVQGLDGLIGFAQHDPSKIIGPFVLSALQFLAAYALSRRLRRTGVVQAVR